MTDPNFSFETPRLSLIHPRSDLDSHCDLFVHLYNTPKFIASEGGKATKVITRDAARKYIQDRFEAEYERHGYGTYMILLKPGCLSSTEFGGIVTDENSINATAHDENSVSRKPDKERGVLVGTISLSNGATPEVSYSAPDLGFAVLPEYCRKGIAMEASQGVMKYAAEDKGVRVFLGLHSPKNQASAGIFRKLGFSWHGNRVLKIVGGAVGMVWAGRYREDGEGFDGLSEEEIRELGLPEEERSQ